MTKFYVTFGQKHIHAVNDEVFDKDSVCEIEAPSEIKARNIAFQWFGAKWAFINDKMPRMELYPRGIIKLQ